MLTLKRIVGFGASSMEGVYDPAGGGFIKRLATWAAANSPTTTVINHGIGGNTSLDMLGRLQRDVVAERPDSVIFLPGINDVPRGDGRPRTPLETYRAKMREIFAALAATAPTLFVTPFRPNCTQLGMDESVLASYMDAARAEARQRGLPIMDLPTCIAPADLPRYWHTDGLHFNPVGHEHIFVLIRDYLLASFASKR